jgi:thiamine biosynthesis lipoprotein
MGTLVTIHVVRDGEDAIERAFGWFRDIEARCSRFAAGSELAQLTRRIGEPVRTSAILFEAVRFAVAVAEDTGGAFDPTVGQRMESRGFNREDRTGRVVQTPVAPDEIVSFRDVHLDRAHNTITLARPLLLDLGAVAKGLAVDAAARELQPFEDFAIDAGGDLYLGGVNPERRAWSVGIRHPRRDGELIDTIQVTNRAVCTSGDYERPAEPQVGGHHIVDPRSGLSPAAVASVTAVAPSAMVADAIATAAFVLGPREGLALMERHAVEGLIVTPALETFTTPLWGRA